MTFKPQLVEEQTGENDFIDEIAQLLPAEQRPLWYRDMAHLRRLPPDDEMLRIARAMGFLAIITRQTPAQITTERERLATILDHGIKAIQSARQDMVALHRRLEERLAQLPAEVSDGINAGAIAGTLSESLRQRFTESGISATAESLTLVAKQTKQVAGEFDRSSKQLAISYRVAAEEARKSMDDMRLTIQTATATARQCANELTHTFLREYKWSVLVLCSAALAVGFSLGVFYYRWVNSSPAEPAQNTITAPVPQNTTPSQPASRPRKAERKVKSEGQVSQ
ncbi:MAG TPA: hypothetical protein VGS27_01895 [Candidatus Sulfotelmatobacter sp.]|nr:hypothetical protein [Candidatus Sulfotelmatobacter sp.]